jgi:DMSO/TMAO reductase YedYZ molybdopterin-dependent catalytic subunit
MKLIWTLLRGAIAGLLAGMAMLLVMGWLRLAFGLPTPTEMIFDRLFPKITIQFFIDSLVRAGGYTPLKLQGVFGALAGHMAAAAFGGAVYAWYMQGLGRRGSRLVIPGVLAAWVLFVALLWPNLLTNYFGLPPATATLASCAGLLVDFAACGLGVMLFYGLLAPKPPDTVAAAGMGRRAFIAGGLGAGVAVLLGATLRRLFQIGTFAYDGREYLGPKVQKITPVAPKDEFYQVSKNLVDPHVVLDHWQFDIVGAVENPRVYSLAEITAMPAVEQETTLLCISYRVGGGLCSNALWKGVPLSSLVAAAKPKAGVSTVLFHASDGYYETFPFAKAMEPATLLAYGMNGGPLPQAHGFPLRLIVPGLYGEKNPKWLTRIELLDADDPRLHESHPFGFYKEQGWGPNFTIPTTSRIDAPLVSGGDHFEDSFTVGEEAEIRGMAFGGDRGISKVEISLDDGKTWQDAPITQPGTLISWSLWHYLWTPAEESDEVRIIVRATDGDGNLQIAESRNTVPQGATGLHRVRARVEAA